MRCSELNLSSDRLRSTFLPIKPMVMEIMENDCTGGISGQLIKPFCFTLSRHSNRPNSLEMGDRGGWGPGAPPGGWGGPPRTQGPQV